MATSRDKEHSRAGSSAHTHLQQLAAAVQPLHTAQQLSGSTLGAAPVPKQRAVTTKNCQNTFTVFFFK